MSLRLVMGVTEAPYSYGDRSQTTGDVAQRLENRYHVMGTFFELYEGNIAAMLEDSVAGALETALMGGPVALTPFEAGCSKIGTLFRQAIDVKAFDGIAGVPTKASLDGVRHSMKNPRFIIKRGKKIKRPPRPSFFDTGNFSRHFVCWIEET